MQMKKIVMSLLCMVLLTASAQSHEALYLIRTYYEVTPGGMVRPLQIGYNTYAVLTEGWTSGDSYCIPAPEKEGYLFLSELSDSLTGIFAREDVYIKLYYTKKPLGFRQNKKPYAETMQYEYDAG